MISMPPVANCERKKGCNMDQMFYRTDVGKVRSHNEDAAEIFKSGDATILAVADGMGGHACGEVASKMVIDTLREALSQKVAFDDPESIRKWMKSLLIQINEEILGYIKEKEVEKGMGTTVVLSVITPELIVFAHIGDSRAYLLSQNRFRQITSDHTFVRKLVEEGKLSEKRAKSHPHRNIIMNALGVGSTVKFDYLVLEKYDLEAVLLCTDGLSSMIEDCEIQKILQLKVPVREKVEKLIDRANEKGGRDNITAALYEFGERSGNK